MGKGLGGRSLTAPALLVFANQEGIGGDHTIMTKAISGAVNHRGRGRLPILMRFFTDDVVITVEALLSTLPSPQRRCLSDGPEGFRPGFMVPITWRDLTASSVVTDR
jgi:hypothetical protein